MNSSGAAAARGSESEPRSKTPGVGRSLLLVAVGVVLVGAALWLRSSFWLRDYILRSKEPAELERMVAATPRDPLARYYLAKSHYLARRFDDAAREYRAALDLEPESARTHIGLGLSLYATGDRPGARNAFERALGIDPDASWPEYMLGKLAWSEGNIDEALRRTKRATELDPRSDEAWYGLASCYTRKRQYPEAIAALRKAVERNPNSLPAVTALGELLVYRGEGEEGRRYLERALTLKPDHATACVLLGKYLFENAPAPADLDRAEQLLKKAIDLRGPRIADVHLDLGRLLARKGRLPEAIEKLNESVRLSPVDERAYFALAGAYRRIGKEKEAAAADRQFRALSALHVRMQQLEAKLHHGSSAPGARLELARVYSGLGMTGRAADQYARYLAEYPGDAKARRELDRLSSAAAPAASPEFNISAPDTQAER